MLLSVTTIYPRHGKGFTLIETIISLLILSIVAVAILKLVSHNQNTAIELGIIEQAVTLAERKMFENLQEGVTSATSREGSFQNNPHFSWKVHARATDITGIYKLILEVTHKDSGYNIILERLFYEGKSSASTQK